MPRRPAQLTIAGLLLLAALSVIVALHGCARQSDTSGRLEVATIDEPAGALANVPGDPLESDAAAPLPDTEPHPPADGVAGQTFGDVRAAFSMPSSFVMTVEEAEGDENESVGTTVAFQMDGTTAVRTREKDPDSREIRIHDYEAGMVYQYEPAEGTGYKMRLNLASLQSPPQPHEACRPDSPVIGSELVDDVDCWIARPLDGDPAMKLWVGKQDGLLRKVVWPEGTVRLRYSQIGQVPDSLFRVPENVELTDMSDAASGAQPGE